MAFTEILVFNWKSYINNKHVLLKKFLGLNHLNLLLLGFGVDSRKCGETELVAPSNIISALRVRSLLTFSLSTLFSVDVSPHSLSAAQFLHE